MSEQQQPIGFKITPSKCSTCCTDTMGIAKDAHGTYRCSICNAVITTLWIKQEDISSYSGYRIIHIGTPKSTRGGGDNKQNHKQNLRERLTGSSNVPASDLLNSIQPKAPPCIYILYPDGHTDYVNDVNVMGTQGQLLIPTTPKNAVKALKNGAHVAKITPFTIQLTPKRLQ
jgi:hypothetical protein